jgi:signal transduction histidine kinase
LVDTHRHLEHKVAERTDELIQAEKMASLGVLAAGVAHEINNPTNFVQVSAQNLKVDLASFRRFIFALAGDNADESIINKFNAKFAPLELHLSTIEEGTDRISLIVRDLRTFTQLDAAQKKTVVLTDCLRATINLVQTKNRNTANFITEFIDEPQMLCYPAQLNQVFMNIIINACDAIGNKLKKQQLQTRGIIRIRSQLVEFEGTEQLEIAIKDNGCGIKTKVMKRLFEPFYTTKDVGEGTGLGLSISYGIVQQHGGQLLVSSQEGVGSEFKLLLPL